MKRNRWRNCLIAIFLVGWILSLFAGCVRSNFAQQTAMSAPTAEFTSTAGILSCAPTVYTHHFPYSAHYDSGAFLVCAEPPEVQQGSHYIAYDADSFAQLENYSFNREITVRGVTVHAEFDYALSNSGVVLTYVPAQTMDHPQCFVQALHDGSSRVLVCFCLSLLAERFLYYPVLIDVSDSAVTDLLASMELDLLQDFLNTQPQNLALGADGYLLVHQGDGKFLCLDLARGTILALNSLLQTTIYNCTLLPGRIVCWDRSGSFFEIILKTWEVSALLQAHELLYTCGLWGSRGLPGCSFALYIDSNRRVCCYDFLTDSSIFLKDVDLDPAVVQTGRICFFPSEDGRKVCITSRSARNEPPQFAVWDADRQDYYSLTAPLLEQASFGISDFSAQGRLILADSDFQNYYYCDLSDGLYNNGY